MSRMFVFLGDRLLGMLLGNVEAGACVPEAGDSCPCRCTRNCYGFCVKV